MELEKLYAEYGKLMVNFEILQGQISNVKKQISDKINEQLKTNNPNVPNVSTPAPTPDDDMPELG